MSPTLSGLFLYPVKSLGGCTLASAEVDALGLVGDRRFLVVDETGRFLTQRTLPRMALVATALDATHLTLSIPPGAHSSGAPSSSIRIARASDPAASLRTVSVWKSENLLAEDCGDAASTFLSDFLSTRCRLVRIGAAFTRPILKTTAHPGDIVTFADAYPFIVISEASLSDLNDRLAERGEDALPMNRFRPNLVVAGCSAFAEDTWTRFRIGTVIFRGASPCARCIVTTTDQVTGTRTGPEPLRTLAGYRRAAANPTDVNFGQNLIHETKTGTLRVGDSVALL